MYRSLLKVSFHRGSHSIYLRLCCGSLLMYICLFWWSLFIYVGLLKEFHSIHTESHSIYISRVICIGLFYTSLFCLFSVSFLFYTSLFCRVGLFWGSFLIYVRLFGQFHSFDRESHSIYTSLSIHIGLIYRSLFLRVDHFNRSLLIQLTEGLIRFIYVSHVCLSWLKNSFHLRRTRLKVFILCIERLIYTSLSIHIGLFYRSLL